MSTPLIILLTLHVFFGIIAITAWYGIWMNLFKERSSWRFIRAASTLGACAIMVSWFTGGYYYITHYGSAVRAIIREGNYSWAHSIGMEFKEHIFLFLPILAIVLWVLARHGEIHEGKNGLKRLMRGLAGVAVALGTIITLAGIIISGAVR